MSNELNIEKLKNLKENIVLDVKVIANSKKNSIEIMEDETWKIRVVKQAIDGKANKEIISYLSDILDKPKSKIRIIRGETSSRKNILIEP